MTHWQNNLGKNLVKIQLDLREKSIYIKKHVTFAIQNQFL
jgi:hypothetical protein